MKAARLHLEAQNELQEGLMRGLLGLKMGSERVSDIGFVYCVLQYETIIFAFSNKLDVSRLSCGLFREVLVAF